MTDMPSLIGGVLCLDFVNTVDPRHTPDRREYLDSYPALVAWAQHAAAIDTAATEQLLETAAVQPPRRSEWSGGPSRCAKRFTRYSPTPESGSRPHKKISMCCTASSPPP